LFLDNLFVLKEYRKEGVAKNLVNIFLEENKSKFSIIKLYSPKSLENFYEKFNFKTKYLTMVLKD
jgi:predicted acetyltransferase